ncbi:hypothetical protein K0M31_016526 [Melipona bicolor]|uniref:Uncharacterized protein n=1 Tax=Melipona bicolor TaxID=60889 RepID=A0AA40FEE7_9HYME|nr:hypothetical protein K0M31_016526 [Melipona bicolor]
MTHLTCINQLSSTVNIRPMLTQAQRIIFSNVTPVIPNSKFENIFKVNNVKLCSKISTFKAGVTDSEYAHCFRRQKENVHVFCDEFMFEWSLYRCVMLAKKCADYEMSLGFGLAMVQSIVRRSCHPFCRRQFGHGVSFSFVEMVL